MKTRVGYAAGGAEGEVSNRLEFFLNLAGFMAMVFTRGPCYTKPHMFARLWVRKLTRRAQEGMLFQLWLPMSVFIWKAADGWRLS